MTKTQKAAENTANTALFARNILSVYYTADLATTTHGSAWYNEAFTIALQLGATYGVGTWKAAGIIAATSPQNEWNRNVAMAERILQNYVAGTSAVKGGGYLTLGLKKCDAILALGSAVPSDIATILNGKKIVNFYNSILGDGNAVCVDGHAFNIAKCGLKRLGITQAGSLTPLQYDIVANAYRAAAEILCIPATVCQAVTWVAYREFSR